MLEGDFFFEKTSIGGMTLLLNMPIIKVTSSYDK